MASRMSWVIKEGRFTPYLPWMAVTILDRDRSKQSTPDRDLITPRSWWNVDCFLETERKRTSGGGLKLKRRRLELFCLSRLVLGAWCSIELLSKRIGARLLSIRFLPRHLQVSSQAVKPLERLRERGKTLKLTSNLSPGSISAQLASSHFGSFYHFSTLFGGFYPFFILALTHAALLQPKLFLGIFFPSCKLVNWCGTKGNVEPVALLKYQLNGSPRSK